AFDIPSSALPLSTAPTSSSAPTHTHPHPPRSPLPTPPPAIARTDFSYFSLPLPRAGPEDARGVPDEEDATPAPSGGTTPPSSSAPSTPGNTPPLAPPALPALRRIRALPSPALLPPSPFVLEQPPLRSKAGVDAGADGDGDDEDEGEEEGGEWETEMELVELESGEMTVRSVRVRRR
ncbi:hypothetical protein K488DRAFT_85659, partial [Vararia minispora EC-137]